MKTLISFFQRFLKGCGELELNQLKVCKNVVIDCLAIIIVHAIYADLLHETSCSTSPNPTTGLIQTVYNVKTWLEHSLNELHGHSSPHCFKFVECSSKDPPFTKTVKMFYKNWSSDPWCEDEEACELLKVCR